MSVYVSYNALGAPDPTARRRPYNRFSPRLAALRLVILATWSGTAGGNGYVVRLARAGAAWSAHAYGGAWDCYLPPAAQLTRDSITSWLTDNAEAIGLQLINDYNARRVWRCDRGWTAKRPSANDRLTGWGWKGHLHIEIHPSRWGDTSPLPPAPAVQRPVSLAATGGAILIPAGWSANVESVQRRLYSHGYILVADGILGPRTKAAIRDFQVSHGLKVDGIVGPLTWSVMA